MHRRRGTTIAIAIALASALILSGCREAPSASDVTPGELKPQRGGTLSYGIEADPNGLDPSKNAWDPVGLLVANALFETLAAFDENGVAQPYLAESITPNVDYTAWKIKLRPDIAFTNSTPLNADTINAGGWFEKLKSSLVTGQAAAYFQQATKIDDLTLEITMSKPWASFPAILTGQGGYVAAPEQLQDDNGHSKPIGTGPFKLENWTVGSRLTVVRNDSYWRRDAEGSKLPYLERIVFDVVPEDAQRLARLADGSLDVVRGTTFKEISELDRLAASGTIKVEKDQAGSAKTLLMFNTEKAPLNDLRVRRGLAHATDVAALAAAHGWPADRLADSPFAPETEWYTKADNPRYDLAEAKRLISEYAREKGPVKIKLSGAYELDLMSAIAEQWRAAGVEVSLAQVDFKTYVIAAVVGDYEAMLFRYFGATDPDTLWHFWSSATAKPAPAIGLNFTRLADDRIDRAIDTGRASPNLAERKQAYADLQRRFAELTPYIWLYHQGVALGHRPAVHAVRNVTLPSGAKAAPFDNGVHRFAETWIEGGA